MPNSTVVAPRMTAIPVDIGQPVVSLHGVSGLFSDRTSPNSVALDSIDLDVESGDFVLISGGPGSGKTTILAAVAGASRPTTGKLLMGGADYWALSRGARSRLRSARIGNVTPIRTEGKSALLDVAAGWHRTRWGSPRPGARERAAHLMVTVGLEGRLTAPASTLSASERQRLGVARALMCRPAVLLADEPTLGLGASAASEFMTLLHRLNADDGLTILITSRDTSFSDYASRHLLMADGRIVDEIAPTDTFTGAAI